MERVTIKYLTRINKKYQYAVAMIRKIIAAPIVESKNLRFITSSPKTLDTRRPSVLAQ
jgi:hypothetical protein